MSPIYSQSTVSIEECQQWAVALSSANVQKELNEQLLKVKINDASSHFYPCLEIIGTASYISAMPQLPEGDMISKDQYRVGMELYQQLFDGGKVFYNRRYQRLMNKNDINKIDLAINKLKEQMISLYLNLLIVEQQNKIFSNLEKTIDDQLRQLRIMLKEGVVYNSTVAQLEVELLKIQQQKGELLAQKNSLSSSLSILTGKDLANAEFTIPTVDDDPSKSESCRLEYAIFKNEIAGLEFQRKLYYANTFPQLSLVGLGGYGRTTFDIFNNDFNWFYFVGITMRVPVINWARTAGVGNIIRLQKSILEAQQSDFEKSNQIEIQEKLNEINRIEDLLTLDNQITQKYNDLTATYRIQLLNGTITIYDFIRQQNDEIQSLINKEVHTIQLLKAKYELKALKGNL
jgi:outer membrane protein TolC